MNKIRILLAPNSFKESKDAVFIAASLQKHFSVNPSIEIINSPVSDGGDGFLNVCSKKFLLKPLTYYVKSIYSDTLNEVIVGYSRESKAVYIESADLIGMKIVPGQFRNPAKFNSKPLGELLKLIKSDVQSSKILASKIIIGVGGTCTNDLGLGVCESFGLQIMDENNRKIKLEPKNFIKAVKLNWRKPCLPFSIETVIDVENPLLGELGAIKMFSEQKGAKPSELDLLEKGFTNIINIIKDNGMIPGSNNLFGAGGGLATGLSLFLNASIKPAKDFIFKDLELTTYMNFADVIIVGEGKFDKQSLLNKATGLIINNSESLNKKIFLICGEAEHTVKELLPDNVTVLELTKYFNSVKESIDKIELGLELVSREILLNLH